MGFIIKIKREGHLLDVLSWPETRATVYINKAGLASIQSNQPCHDLKLFELCQGWDRSATLLPLSPVLGKESQSLSVESPYLFHDKLNLKWKELDFTIICLSSSTDIFTKIGDPDLISSRASSHQVLCHELNICLPIIPKLKYSVGSHLRDLIRISAPFIKPTHFEFVQNTIFEIPTIRAVIGIIDKRMKADSLIISLLPSKIDFEFKKINSIDFQQQ